MRRVKNSCPLSLEEHLRIKGGFVTRGGLICSRGVTAWLLLSCCGGQSPPGETVWSWRGWEGGLEEVISVPMHSGEFGCRKSRFLQTAISLRQQRRLWPQSVLQLKDLLQASRLFAPSPCGQRPSNHSADRSRPTRWDSVSCRFCSAPPHLHSSWWIREGK